jgi:uncharacterized membrane protein
LEAATPARGPSGIRPERDGALDLLRGIVIVLMVVDHVRYFLSSYRGNPTDPAVASAALFFTRWITHFCAPVFMLLAGAGAYLALDRGRSRETQSRFLLTRGLWLVLLELTVARWGWQFNLDYHYTSALVFWALGWSMVALAGLVWLSPRAVTAIGVAMIVTHNLLDGVTPERLGQLAPLWALLHAPGILHPVPGVTFAVVYPLMPWIGVMAAGYGFGALIRALAPRSPFERNRPLLWLGLGLTATFLLLRLANVYGDPAPWSVQDTPVRTLLSFLNTTKYPPSLLFLLMTLGPAIAALPLLYRVPSVGRLARWAGAVRTVGRVSLFFWLLHVPLVHGVAAALSLARYGRVDPWLFENPPIAPPAGYGYGLVVVYVVTLGVVIALYPACHWFAALKRRRRDAWLSYL